MLFWPKTEYSLNWVLPVMPNRLATLTMCPFPAAIIPGKKACMSQKWEITLTPNVLDSASGFSIGRKKLEKGS